MPLVNFSGLPLVEVCKACRGHSAERTPAGSPDISLERMYVSQLSPMDTYPKIRDPDSI